MSNGYYNIMSNIGSQTSAPYTSMAPPTSMYAQCSSIPKMVAFSACFLLVAVAVYLIVVMMQKSKLSSKLDTCLAKGGKMDAEDALEMPSKPVAIGAATAPPAKFIMLGSENKTKGSKKKNKEAAKKKNKKKNEKKNEKKSKKSKGKKREEFLWF